MTPTNALTLVPDGQDEDLRELQITDEGLSEFITIFLKEVGDARTASDVLEKPAFADFLVDSKELYKLQVQQINEERGKKRRALEMAKQKADEDAAIQLRQTLRAKFGMPKVLSQDEIRASAQAANAKVTAKPAIAKQPTGEERRANLRKQFGLMLPDLVFQSAERAVAFRQVLKNCIQPLRDKLKEPDLEAQYKAAIGQLYNAIQQHLFPMTDRVITDGWSLELKTPVRSNNLFDEVVGVVAKDKRFAEMMRWMGKCPTSEDLKALAQAKTGQQAEVQVLDEVETARRNQLKDSLKARMAEVDGGQQEKHELQATSLMKHQGHLPDIKVIFMARAVFQMTPKVGKKLDQDTAEFYAKCADVPFEVVLGVVAANAQSEQKPNGGSKKTDPSPKPATPSNGAVAKPTNAQRRVARAKRDQELRSKQKSVKGSSGFRSGT